jgi:hypothetical protein
MRAGSELALFKKANPYLPQGGRYSFQQSSLLYKKIGEIYNCCETPIPTITVPDSPTLVTAIIGDNEATISFTLPEYDGGSPIVSYSVISSPDNITATGLSSPITITGLDNGTLYTFTVVATNEVGNSDPSSTSNAVSYSSVPDSPTSVTATEGNSQATISFTAPDDNGSAIVSYTVRSSPGNITATGSSSPITVTGLTNGISYTFTVVATNGVGNSTPSSASNAVLFVSVPQPPTSVSASFGETQSNISFTPPTNDGGSAITSYTVTSSPEGITATGSSSPITITGLTLGTSYTFTVVATNGEGDSVPSSPSPAFTAGDDAITASLTTSLSNYQSAATDEWIQITSGEYANLQTNVSGTTLVGITTDYLTGTSSGGLANSGSAVVANSVTTKSPAIPANSYLYAFAVRWVTAEPAVNMCVFTNTNTGSAVGFNQVGSVLPNTTAAGVSYYVRKGVTISNGSTAGLLACFTGTRLDYPNPSFTGSAGYIGFKYLVGTSPIPNMFFTMASGSIPGPNINMTGGLPNYGAFLLQGLTTNAIQWI